MYASTQPKAARRAFTLIELLIVIGVIAVLIGILAPVLSAARSRGKLASCSNNLRQIGLGMRSYLDANADIYPYASSVPSIGPGPIFDSDAPIYIADVLLTHAGGDPKVFACPNDIDGADRPAPFTGTPYFKSEKSSYEYRTRLAGKTMESYLKERQEDGRPRIPENTVWVFQDYWNFHGEPGKNGARRYLYNDNHVTDFEN
jgi:prepilin-type N-terminal cleavage/methylation domain-containing protein